MGTLKHYKMFKKGKNWCFMAIATVAVAIGALNVSTQANADVNSAANEPVATAVQNQSTATSSSVANSDTAAANSATVVSASNSAVSTNVASSSTSVSPASDKSAQTSAELVSVVQSAVPKAEVKLQVAAQPAQLKGWQTQNGQTYYYRNGQKVTGTQTIGNAQYYFNDQGQQKKDYFLTQNNHTYYYQKNGQRLNGGFYSNWGHTYYFGNDGARWDNRFYNNWGHTYYFGGDGARWDNRFYNNWGHTYYFQGDGARLDNGFYNNWGNTYYFGSDGARYTNQTYSNWGHTYWFGNDGALLRNGYVFLNSQDWYAQSDGVLRTTQYFSQFTPINAPEGCSVAALAMLLSTKGKFFNLGYAYNHVPQSGGVYNTGAFSGIIPAGALAWWAYKNIDSSVRDISGRNLSQIASIVATGHPVLYYGFSSFERAYANRNHAKVIIGESNGYFHVLDPCYWGRGQGAHSMGGNTYDTGADSWRSWSSVASEYNGSAITIY